MRTDVIMAIDAGTTGVTALLIDPEGRILSEGYHEFPQYFPHDGWVEQELGEIWSASLAAARDALAGVDRSRANVVAIGITNQRETLCLWDRETLGAARRAIVWQDRRSADICERLRAEGHETSIAAATGLRLDPYFTATKITWVRENEPHVWSQVTNGRVAIGTVDSYLLARLTRGLHHATDATNASRTLLYSLHSGTWDPDLCDLFGVPIDALPEIVSSYGVIGRSDPSSFLGLAVPIAGIAGDQQAALVGQLGFSTGAAKCTYGTGSFLLVHTGATAPTSTTPTSTTSTSTHGLLATVALQHPDGRRDFAVEGSVFVTGAAVQWLRDGLGIITSAPEVEALARQVPDSGGVVFVPALTGLGAPDWDPYARGLIIGINRATTAAHLARATLDSIAFQVADIVELMRMEAGVSLTCLAVDGGAAGNSLLCQLQADALGIRVDRAAQVQTTGLGAAFLAGLGIGVWASTDDLLDTRRSSGIFNPGQADPAAHQRWRRAVERSKGWATPTAP